MASTSGRDATARMRRWATASCHRGIMHLATKMGGLPAHVGERGAATSAIETQDAVLTAKLERQNHIVADLDRRLGQIDSAIEEAARRGKTNTALAAIDAQ